MVFLGLAGRKQQTGLQDLQDLQDRVLGISWAQTIDRITGLQDLQDGLFKTKQGTNYGQDCRIYRIGCQGLAGRKQQTGWQDLQDEGLGLNWGLTMDRITGWQDLKD